MLTDVRNGVDGRNAIQNGQASHSCARSAPTAAARHLDSLVFGTPPQLQKRV